MTPGHHVAMPIPLGVKTVSPGPLVRRQAGSEGINLRGGGLQPARHDIDDVRAKSESG